MADTPVLPPIHAIADELYSLDPSEFTARRDAWVKQAKTLKRKEEAAQIQALRRPTVAASYLNRAIRAPLASLEDFLELGEPMREAQAALSVAELTEFGKQRRALEDAVVSDLAKLLQSEDITPSPASLDEVRSTLTAALADPDAEQAVRSGCLARTLSYAGFGPVDLDKALAADPATVAPVKGKRDRSHLSVVPDPVDVDDPAAPDETEDAKERAEQERQERERLEEERRAAERRAMRERAERMLSRLERAQERAEAQHAKALSAQERATEARDRAQEALEEAQAALDAAEEKLSAASEATEQAATELSEATNELEDQRQLLADWGDAP